MFEALPAPDRVAQVAELIRLHAKPQPATDAGAVGSRLEFHSLCVTVFGNGVRNRIKFIWCREFGGKHSYSIVMHRGEGLCIGGLASWEECAQGIVKALEGDICMECGSFGKPDHVCKHYLAAIFKNLTPEDCSICHDKCTGVTKLHCGHVFHVVCLSRVKTLECPNCRAEIPYEEAVSVGMRQDEYEDDDDE